MALYHGTSRVFGSFDAGAQEGGQLGSAFYFTDNEAVAENFAVFRHVPERVRRALHRLSRAMPRRGRKLQRADAAASGQ